MRVIACEIACRELYHVAARSPNLVDLEFLTQGHHDVPARGREELQARIDAVPANKYDAVVLGYGLCSNILCGLTARQTPLVIPRAHDCITFFLGSKERYRETFEQRPGTYYFTSGWLECAKRRGEKGSLWGGASVPASASLNLKAAYEVWVEKYGKEQADYLVEEMSRWTDSYSHGTLIEFDFLRHLKLKQRVQEICADKGWEYSEMQGDLSLLQNLVNGDWPEAEFIRVHPGQKVMATHDERVLRAA
ncbi:MAG TPA: DUF1638 domain-containing protein [Verrucomicrobiae bacterium]|nr:DUF1638 domain-containing protein [Verrucomicrobiae bacterium]